MSHPTILLIDFDASSIDHARSSLTQAGYRVEVARDGVSGLEAFQRLKPDLVLVEAILPKKHGFQVCQEIKNTPYGKCTPILVTSSEALGTKYVQDALQLYGCDEYVEKPISDDELVGFCQRLLPEVVVTPKVAIELPEPASDSQRLDDLSEDELMQRLDQLIDRATEQAEEPLSPAPGEREPSREASEADASRRPIGEVDLVAFCERVFPRSGNEDVPRLEETIKKKGRPTTPAKSEKASARLLNEEEVVGQLDALARKDPRGGLLPRTAAPVVIDTPPPVDLSSMVELESRPTRRSPWTEERRRRLVWRTGLSGTVLVGVGLILLAVAKGRLPVEPQEVADLAQAGPLATPPASAAPDEVHTVAGWDATPIEWPAGRPERAAPPRTPPAARKSQSKPVAASETKTPAADALPERQAAAVDPGTVAASENPQKEDENAPELGAAPPSTPTGPAAVSLAELLEPEASLVGLSSTETAPAASSTDADELPFTLEPSPEAMPEPPPAPSGTRRGEIVPIESVDRRPVPLERPLPLYDPVSRRMRRQGTVVVEALIDETGAVADVRLVDGIPHSRLNDAALDAVRRWSYRPAIKDGEAVRVWKTISLQFKP